MRPAVVFDGDDSMPESVVRELSNARSTWRMIVMMCRRRDASLPPAEVAGVGLPGRLNLRGTTTGARAGLVFGRELKQRKRPARDVPDEAPRAVSRRRGGTR